MASKQTTPAAPCWPTQEEPDLARCDVCGRQATTCGCDYRHFYPDYDDRADPGSRDPVVPACGLPEDVYERGLSDAQRDEWARTLVTVRRALSRTPRRAPTA